ARAVRGNTLPQQSLKRRFAGGIHCSSSPRGVKAASSVATDGAMVDIHCRSGSNRGARMSRAEGYQGLSRRPANQYHSVPLAYDNITQTGRFCEPATWADVLDVVITRSIAATCAKNASMSFIESTVGSSNTSTPQCSRAAASSAVQSPYWR